MLGYQSKLSQKDFTVKGPLFSVILLLCLGNGRGHSGGLTMLACRTLDLQSLLNSWNIQMCV